jgi:hypothetical protein
MGFDAHLPGCNFGVAQENAQRYAGSRQLTILRCHTDGAARIFQLWTYADRFREYLAMQGKLCVLFSIQEWRLTARDSNRDQSDLPNLREARLPLANRHASMLQPFVNDAEDRPVCPIGYGTVHETT